MKGSCWVPRCVLLEFSASMCDVSRCMAKGSGDFSRHLELGWLADAIHYLPQKSKNLLHLQVADFQDQGSESVVKF